MIKITATALTLLISGGALAQGVDCQPEVVQTHQGLVTHICLAPTHPTPTISPEQAAFMERHKNWDKTQKRAIAFGSIRTIHNPDGSIHRVQVVPRVTNPQN